MFDAIQAAALLQECSYCLADPGERCKTKSGGQATYQHGARTVAAQYAYWAGYQEAIVRAHEDPEYAVREYGYIQARRARRRSA